MGRLRVTTLQQAPVEFAHVNGTSSGGQRQQQGGTGFSALLFIFLCALGTGGVTKVVDAQSPTSSGGRVRSQPPRAVVTLAPVVGTLSVEEQVAMLRESLSLNMTQLAKGLGVGRAALYGWLSDARVPRLKHLVRLKELYDVASYWRRLSSKSLGKYLIMPLNNGTSVARMLTKAPLPTGDLKVALEAIASDMLASDTRKRSSGYRSVTSVMQERGYKPLPGDETRSLDLDDLAT